MKVAAVVTESRGRCHAQQLIDRLLWGYPGAGVVAPGADMDGNAASGCAV